jgi:hypothetical protein
MSSVRAGGFGAEASGEVLLDFALRPLRRGSVAISLLAISARALRFAGIG